jgi:hypothetical protein
MDDWHEGSRDTFFCIYFSTPCRIGLTDHPIIAAQIQCWQSENMTLGQNSAVNSTADRSFFETEWQLLLPTAQSNSIFVKLGGHVLRSRKTCDT